MVLNKYLLVLLPIVNSVLAFASTADPLADSTDAVAKLVIQLTNIQQQQGEIRIALYNDAESYAERGDAIGIMVPANQELVVATFDAVKPGEVVILLFHDLNSNGRLDTNLLGIPNEPYASSTGKRGRFGPPSWEDGLITIEAGDNFLEISLR